MAPNPMAERLAMALTWVEDVLDSKGEPHTPSHPVWHVLSRLLDEVLSPKYIYVIIKERRWNLESSLAGLRPKGYVGINDDSTETEDDEQADESMEILPHRDFIVNILPDQWSAIKPVLKQQYRADRSSKKRNKLKMAKDQWTHELANLFYDQHPSYPCALVFKNTRVAIEPTLAKNYFSTDVLCNECGNSGQGYILSKPMEGETAVLHLNLVDTRRINHFKKRQCAGSERARVGGCVKDGSCAVFRRQEASRLIRKPGDPESPLLYPLGVYRKVKHEVRAELDLPKSNNALLTLQQMKYKQDFIGSIHDIGLDPIKVYYLEPSQILLHNTLQKQGYYAISLDATSGLIRRMTKVCGLSGHIFLYQFTCSTANGTAQLNQFLSEQQDAGTLISWIIDWMRRGARTPREVVVDDSPALLSAVARTFARCPDTKTYKEMCHKRLSDPQAPLPSCYIRLDLAHFISNVFRWEVWKKEICNKMVKDHYMRFVGLMIKEKSFTELTKTLRDIFCISLSPTSGNDCDGKTTLSQAATNRLVDKVSGMPIVDEIQLLNKLDQDEEDEEDEVDTPLSIKDWVTELKSNTVVVEEGMTPNPYYSIKVADQIEKVARTSVLWSAVMVPIFGSPFDRASSADVEGDFNDVKSRVLKNETKPIKLPRFVAMHLGSIKGQTNLVSAHAKKTEESTQSYSEDEISDSENNSSKKNSKKRHLSSSSSSEDEGAKDLKKTENWRNLAQKDTTPSRKKKRKSYLDPCPQIQVAQEQLKMPKNLLLQNGNLCRHIEYEYNTSVRITNTCPFDSIVQVLTLAYLEDGQFRRSVIDAAEEVMCLKVVQSLAINGATSPVYALRTQALVGHCKLVQIIEPRLRKEVKKNAKSNIKEYTAFAKESSLGLEYSAYGNLRSLMEMLFVEFPSSIVYWSCENGHEGSDAKVLLEINMEELVDQGFEELEHLIIQNVRNTCTVCDAQVVDQVEKYSGHLFLNSDILMPPNIKSKYSKQYKLSELPHAITVKSLRYVLVGIVSFRQNHYVGYGRTKVNKWEVMDDMSKKIYMANAEEQVLPHLLIYISRSEFQM